MIIDAHVHIWTQDAKALPLVASRQLYSEQRCHDRKTGGGHGFC